MWLCKFNRFFYLLPPANVVCEGYVFTGVCLSTGGGQGETLVRRPSPGKETPPPWQGDPPARRPPPVNVRAVRILLECNLVFSQMYWLLSIFFQIYFLTDHHCKTRLELTGMLKNSPNLLNFLLGNEAHRTLSTICFNIHFLKKLYPP